MTATLLHGVSCAGVMFDQFPPRSRLIQILPSSVPAQSRRALRGEGASEYTTPRFGWPLLSASVASSRFAGWFSFGRPVRSGLIIFHDLPSFVDANTC